MSDRGSVEHPSMVDTGIGSDMGQTPSNNWFRGYCFLWASAALFHQASLQRIASNPVLLLLTLVAALVLFSPKRLGYLVVLAGAQIVEVVTHAPYYSNHWMLTTTVNVALLLATVGSMVTAATWTPSTKRVLSLFVPAARGLILGLYFWAVFHKLNSGFFATETSCATDLLAGFGPLVPSAVQSSTAVRGLMIAATLIVETAIPLLLFFRPTRLYGVLAGAFFHYMIGFNVYEAYYNFSSALLAIFWLFLEPDWVDGGIVKIEAQVARFSTHRWWPLALLGFRLTFLFLLCWLALWGRTSSKYQPLMVTIWVGYGAAFLLFVALQARSLGFRSQASNLSGSWRAFRPAQAWMLLVPILFFLNGAGPYVGGKTEQSLAMFSNLATEAGKSNHFIVRKPLSIFPFQERVVEILSTNDTWLDELRKEGRGMVWFEFRDYLSRHQEASVTYRLEGKVVEVSRAGEMPEFRAPTSMLARKYLFFRHPDLGSPPRCAH